MVSVPQRALLFSRLIKHPHRQLLRPEFLFFGRLCALFPPEVPTNLPILTLLPQVQSLTVCSHNLPIAPNRLEDWHKTVATTCMGPTLKMECLTSLIPIREWWICMKGKSAMGILPEDEWKRKPRSGGCVLQMVGFLFCWESSQNWKRCQSSGRGWASKLMIKPLDHGFR